MFQLMLWRLEDRKERKVEEAMESMRYTPRLYTIFASWAGNRVREGRMRVEIQSRKSMKFRKNENESDFCKIITKRKK